MRVLHGQTCPVSFRSGTRSQHHSHCLGRRGTDADYPIVLTTGRVVSQHLSAHRRAASARSSTVPAARMRNPSGPSPVSLGIVDGDFSRSRAAAAPIVVRAQVAGRRRRRIFQRPSNPDGYRIVANSVPGGLHHEYRL